MDRKSLMIGDFVNISYRGLTLKVIGIDARKNIVLVEAQDNFKLQIPYDEEEINPIPLTGEMLEANGFQYSSHEYTYWPDEDGVEPPFHILHSKRYGFRIDIPYRVITLEYVHQLQQALRLCGLNDLADNFKI